MIERGLFDLYEILSEETGNAMIDGMNNKIAPVMHTPSELSNEINAIIHYIAGEGCAITPGNRPDSFWVVGERQLGGIPRMLITIESYAASDFANDERPAQRVEMLANIRTRLEEIWRAALEQPGTEPRGLVTPEWLLQPAPLSLPRALSSKDQKNESSRP